MKRKAGDDKQAITSRDNPTWFDRVNDIVSWRVEAPRAYNPFSTGIPTTLLEKLVTQKEVLLRHILVRGLVDGYEVVCIKDLRDFVFQSDHMVIRTMNSGEMSSYFKRAGLHEWLDRELTSIQAVYREELLRRAAERKDREPKDTGETVKQKRARLWREKQAAENGDRGNSIYSGGAKNPFED